MRILELIIAPIEGGAHTLVASLTRQWRSQGHDVDVLALDPAPTALGATRSLELFGFDVPVLRSTRRLSDRFPLKQSLRLVCLRKAVARGHYDVIQAHCMQPNIYSRVASLGTTWFPPIVVTMHSPNGDYGVVRTRIAERLLLNRAAAVITVSDGTADGFRDMFPNAAPKVVVIPNGMPREVTRRSAFASVPTRFLALSRVHPQKDIVTMIRGFDHFLRSPSVVGELAIAGGFDNPAYEAEVASTHRALASRDRIRFLGSRSDVVELLAASDVFVHTATSEAHSIAILEAAAAALPIVSSDLPSIRESIGSTAEYFPPGDAEGLARALQHVTEQWPQRTRLAVGLAEEVVSRYSMQACGEAHLAVLARAADERGNAKPTQRL